MYPQVLQANDATPTRRYVRRQNQSGSRSQLLRQAGKQRWAARGTEQHCAARRSARQGQGAVHFSWSGWTTMSCDCDSAALTTHRTLVRLQRAGCSFDLHPPPPPPPPPP
eukprot:COSAG06_NODE_1446_length_9441_cov_7.431813_1_plen_109_part_10